jgi:hypothetical protein
LVTVHATTPPEYTTLSFGISEGVTALPPLPVTLSLAPARRSGEVRLPLTFGSALMLIETTAGSTALGLCAGGGGGSSAPAAAPAAAAAGGGASCFTPRASLPPFQLRGRFRPVADAMWLRCGEREGEREREREREGERGSVCREECGRCRPNAVQTRRT